MKSDSCFLNRIAPFITATALLCVLPAITKADGLYVASSGSVGVGTATPGAYKLNVVGSIFGTQLDLKPGAGNATVLLESTSHVQYDQSMIFRDPGGEWIVGQRYQTAANDFGIGTSAAKDQFILTSDGRLGIGKIPTSGYILDVKGDAHLGFGAANAGLVLESTNSVQYDQSLTFRDPGGDWTIGQRWQSGAHDFGIGTSSAKSQLVINANGNVTIGGSLTLGAAPVQTSGVYDLCMDGTAQLVNCTSSSMRFKENVHDLNNGLAIINALRPVSFRWRADDSADVGLIAEEVEKVAPELVTRAPDNSVDGVAYRKLATVLASAVQEQQKQIDELREAMSHRCSSTEKSR